MWRVVRVGLTAPVLVIEPGAVWTEWGGNVPEEPMCERREDLDALQPEETAQALVDVLAQPPHVPVEDIVVRPAKQIAP